METTMRNIDTFCLEDLKKEVGKSLGQKFDLPRPVIHEAVRHSLQAIRQALVEGKRVRLESIGVLWPYERKARKGRNPLTGQQLMIPPRKYFKFRISHDLYHQMNGLSESDLIFPEEEETDME
jgi:nucleoid DNA-binding protein